MSATIPRLSLHLQQEMVKVHCKYSRLLCAWGSILYLFPLFQSARWSILLTSKKLYSNDLLFLSDLVKYALEDYFFTRERSRRRRFQAVDQSLQASLLSSVLTSSFRPVGKESLFTLLNRVPSRPCCFQMLR